MIKNKKSILIQTALAVFLLATWLDSCIFSCKPPTGPATPTENTHKEEEARKKAVILLHGIKAEGGLIQLRDELQKSLQDTATVIALDRANSEIAPLDQQTEDTHAQLQEALKSKGLTGSWLIMVGHSQGGVLALKVAQKYPKGVIGVITLQSPLRGINLEGDPSLKSLKIELNDPNSQLVKKTILPLQQHLNNLGGSSLDLKAMLVSIADQFNFSKPGITDLDQEASCIKDIKNFIQSSPIPILAMGGKVDNLILGALGLASGTQAILELMNNNASVLEPYLIALNKELARYIGHPMNDGLITLDSQLANSLSSSKLQRHTYEGEVFHGGPIQSKDYDQLINFIKKTNKPSS
jgi:pimeloyl-ACP methyl ester carboxylesterase